MSFQPFFRSPIRPPITLSSSLSSFSPKDNSNSEEESSGGLDTLFVAMFETMFVALLALVVVELLPLVAVVDVLGRARNSQF